MLQQEKLCAICVTNNDNQWHKLNCNHEFHTTCILKWFRQGGSTCPCCRCSDESNLGYFDVKARSAYLRSASRRKNAPIKLRSMVKNIQVLEEKFRALGKIRKKYKHRHKKVLGTVRRQNGQRWRLSRRIHLLRRKIGLYNDKNFPIPLVVPRRRSLSRTSRTRVEI